MVGAAVLGFAAIVGGCESQPLCTPESPCVPGGGGAGAGGGGSGQVDAAPGDGGTDAAFTRGRVCLTTDLRFPARCANTGADGFTVSYGNLSATTSADGTFAFTAAPTTMPSVIKARRVNFITSLVPNGKTVLIPTVATAVYDQFLFDNAFVLPADTGTVFARVLNVGAAYSGATVVAVPVALAITRYAGSNAITWEVTATGAEGIAALPGVAAGTIDIVVTPTVGAARTFTGIPVEGAAVTFVGLEISP